MPNAKTKKQAKSQRSLALPPNVAIDIGLAAGRKLRETVSRASHSVWRPPANRTDPIETLIESSRGRVEQLIPIRYGRMLQSPFAFFRGAASIMAADLATTPATGLNVQACGDCHLLNFGLFATPERRLMFDLNDFDETHPGPWEWDLKRLAASFVIASRHNRFADKEAEGIVETCMRSYRERMTEYASMRALELWYTRLEAEDLYALIDDPKARKETRARVEKQIKKGTVEHHFPKLIDETGGKPRIRDNPPLIFHPDEASRSEYQVAVREGFQLYRESLSPDRRFLLDRYELVDGALKVVGVGSVGTRCYILLLMAGPSDPLFLQVKEARRSVLEPFTGPSPYDHQGQRVVVGQRLTQAASDIFLGWTVGRENRHFYIRQLRDMKVAPTVEAHDEATLRKYAIACGWALARAHARTGPAAQIAGYLGKSGRFDEAMAVFALSYADQNERDHARLLKAVREGRLAAEMER